MKTLTAILCGVGLLALSAAAAAQSKPGASDHFTFTVANGTNRLGLNVKIWADDAARNRLATALREGGANGLENALKQLPESGYLDWTDGLQYIVRYACRMPVPGGEDVVLAMDHPLTFWWDPNISASMASAPFTVVQLHLGEDGRGEGKAAALSNIVAGKDSIVLQNYAQLPTVMTEVRRERVGG